MQRFLRFIEQARYLPKFRKIVQVFSAVGIAFLLACIINISSQPSSLGIQLSSIASSQSGNAIQVYVLGAVVHPGIYTLHDGDRVEQLLQDAGGTLTNANLISINLVARLYDGEEVYIPRIGETPPANVASTSGQLNINIATAQEMQTRLHMSAATAQRIVNYRNQHGPFTSVDGLLAVPVSKATLDRIRTQVTV